MRVLRVVGGGLAVQARAARTGLQPSAISHFEGGARKPSFEHLRRLAPALEVATDFLKLAGTKWLKKRSAIRLLAPHSTGTDAFQRPLPSRFRARLSASVRTPRAVVMHLPLVEKS